MKLHRQGPRPSGFPISGVAPRAFFFHYNKPASQRAGYPQISIHWAGTCLIVSNVTCKVPTQGRVNMNRQPKWVLTGRGVVRVAFTTLGNIATITAT